MSVKASDKIIAPSRGSAKAVKAYARDHDASQLLFVFDYIETVYELCEPDTMPDAAIVVGQSAHETADPSPWQSYWFRERGNVAGLGITGDPTQNNASKTFQTGAEAARAHVAHLVLYATGEVDRGGLKPSDDPRYDDYRDAYGSRAMATTVNALTNKWGVDDQYADGVVKWSNILQPNLPDQGSTPSTTTTPAPTQPGGPPVGTKPYLLLVSGHRSYNDGGNPTEKDLTDDLGRIYTQVFRDAGYKADWWQRDLDKDNDPDDTVGGLDTVSLGCAAHLAKISGPKVLLDLHFNGSTSPVHAIIPDSRGLTTAYSGGAPADDTYANNTLDRAFAAKWAQGVAAAFGLSLFRGRASEPGVMLESETGVGIDGYRLATMAASARVRADTIRSVLEHAGTSQWGSGAVREAKFVRCAQIAVAAVAAVYNVNDETPSTTTTPPPTPTDPKYTSPALPEWFASVLKADYPTNQDFNGTTFLACKKRLVVKKAAVQRATAGTKGKESGPALKAGTVVDILGVFKSGSTKYVLAAGGGDIAPGARIKMADLSEVITITERAA